MTLDPARKLQFQQDALDRAGRHVALANQFVNTCRSRTQQFYYFVMTGNRWTFGFRFNGFDGHATSRQRRWFEHLALERVNHVIGGFGQDGALADQKAAFSVRRTILRTRIKSSDGLKRPCACDETYTLDG